MLTSPPVPLTALLQQLDAAFGPETTHGAWLVRVEGTGDELALGLLDLDTAGSHPVDALLGFRADPSWRAAGLIVHGDARQLGAAPAEDPLRPAPPRPAVDDGPPRRLRAVHAIAADGTEASVLHYLDGACEQLQPGPAEGRLADCCRRIMGLATPPPPVPLLHWLATVWLSRVLARLAERPGRRLGWRQVVALHPLAGLGPLHPARFAATIADQVEQTGWEALRLELADRPGPRPATVGLASVVAGLPAPVLDGALADLTPEVAAWMDEGMFARWLVGAFPDPIDLLIDLAELLEGPELEPLMEVLRAWGLW